MKTVAVDAQAPSIEVLDTATSVLDRGGLVALPTETLYGLAVDALDADALERLNRIKGKPPGSPILVLAADLAQVSRVAEPAAGLYDELARAFWPGPLTLVVAARRGTPPVLGGGRGTVGVRIPGLALPRRLARSLGRPISGVSANLHRDPPARQAGDLAPSIVEGADLVLDGGAVPGSLPSTLLDLTGPQPVILREGAIPKARLEPYLKDA